MILMGDEVGRTQNGNNNTYCHDNELNWFDWDLLEKNADLLQFFQQGDRLPQRASGPAQPLPFCRHSDYVGSGIPDMSFHGTEAVAARLVGQQSATHWRSCCAAITPKAAKCTTIISMSRLNTYWDAV